MVQGAIAGGGLKKSATMRPKMAPKAHPDTKRVRDKLVAAGVRPTRQRLDLGRLLLESGDRHFTAEMIYDEARAMRYPPSLGTIYTRFTPRPENPSAK
jgi:Fur family iron response transcriptional regulator